MKPAREIARNNSQTYFVSFQTAERKAFFRNERWAILLLKTVQRYADAGEYQLHDFVIMIDHVHFLKTPNGALERSVQLIKGGFSFQAKRAFTWSGDIWQAGFTDHRIRDSRDFERHIAYIEQNCRSLNCEEHRYCGRNAGLALAPGPQWLKPPQNEGIDGRAQARPLQSRC